MGKISDILRMNWNREAQNQPGLFLDVAETDILLLKN